MAIANPRERSVSSGASDASSWMPLVRKIRAGDPAGMEELYQIFSRGVRYYLWRQLGPQDLEDKLHDTFLIVARAIHRGDLREPDRLMGFVRTVARRQVADYVDQAVRIRQQRSEFDPDLQVSDDRADPESAAIAREREALALKVLQSVSARDREILVRFYLHGQSQEYICAEMNLTATQFRLLKSRAKARFGEMGKRAMLRKPPQAKRI